MGKKIFSSAVFLTLLLSGFLICSINMSYAQPKGPPPDKKDMPDKKEISPEKMAEQTAGMLKRDLNLTDEQYKQIYDFVFNYHTSHNESTFDREELNAEIESVLTQEQRDKFDKIKKEQERLEKRNKESEDGPPQDGPPQDGPPQDGPPQGKPPRN